MNPKLKLTLIIKNLSLKEFTYLMKCHNEYMKRGEKEELSEKLKPPYIIRFEWSGLKVTIEANSLESLVDAYLVGSAVLKETNELGHGQPKLFLTHLVEKKKGKES